MDKISETPWHWETWMTHKKELVQVVMSTKRIYNSLIIDYSNTHFKRLSELLENTKQRAINTISEDWKNPAIAIKYILWIECFENRWIKAILREDARPCEVELEFSSWINMKGTIYLKTNRDAGQRLDSSRFINIINVYEVNWTKTQPMTFLCNTEHIASISEIRRLWNEEKRNTRPQILTKK